MIDEYIKSELEDAIVDPDSNLTYRKRKIDRELASSSHETVASISVNANTIKKETRNQSNSERWKPERKHRFTASQFCLVFHRQRSHDKFAQEIMFPKTFHSRNTAHGIKYEPVAIDRYH